MVALGERHPVRTPYVVASGDCDWRYVVRVDLISQESMASVRERFYDRLGGDKAATDVLAEAWLRGVVRQATELNLAGGPSPSTLGALRADLLMHVSIALGRLVTEREAEVILRLTPAAARTAHRTMKAIYEDLLEDYVWQWTFAGAYLDKKRGSFLGVIDGYRVNFTTKDAADAAVAELRRRGVPVERKTDEPKYRNLLYVGKGVDLAAFGLQEFKS